MSVVGMHTVFQCLNDFINYMYFMLWLMVVVIQGGDEIDDIFGCTTSNNGGELTVADTYNVAGGERSNVGDSSGSV